MNNDILFTVSKYCARKSNTKIDQAFVSAEIKKYTKDNIKEYLNNKLSNRPSKEELESKNIIKKDFLNFSTVHEILEKIPFKTFTNGISPRIANIANKINFCIKRKIMIQKLGLNKLFKK